MKISREARCALIANIERCVKQKHNADAGDPAAIKLFNASARELNNLLGDVCLREIDVPVAPVENPAPTDDEMERQQIDILRADAGAKLREAEKSWHALACALPVGSDRERAFDVYENVRTAPRVGRGG